MAPGKELIECAPTELDKVKVALSNQKSLGEEEAKYYNKSEKYILKNTPEMVVLPLARRIDWN